MKYENLVFIKQVDKGSITARKIWKADALHIHHSELMKG